MSRRNLLLIFHPCVHLVRILRRRIILVIAVVVLVVLVDVYFSQNAIGEGNLKFRTKAKGIVNVNDARNAVLPKFVALLQRAREKIVESAANTRTSLACKLPKLNPYHESILPHLRELGELDCGISYSKFENNVLLVEGEGISSVKYQIIHRPDNDDFSSTLSESVFLNDTGGESRGQSREFQELKPGKFIGRAKVDSDFIRVTISREGKGDTVELHMNTASKPEVLRRRVEPGGIPVNVAMIMFDSTSAANFKRKMKKTNEFIKGLPTVFLQGETIVGDGTTAQLAAMLTGIAEKDQPEARRKMPNSRHCDDWRFIFRDFAKRGYVTMYSEDSPQLATFNFRLHGFRNPPADHYGRYFWFEAEKHRPIDHCVGSDRYHMITMRYLLSLFRTYPNNPKFAFLLFSELVHSDINTIEYADSDLVHLLTTMKNESFLNKTIVFIFGDHGPRFGYSRMTLQGKLEERLPHMSVTFPKWFPETYPQLYTNFQRNAEVLTTPFDIYATLQHLMSYPLPPKGIKTGQSLFTSINPQNRTCATAGVEDHWCPCLKFESVAVTNPIVRTVANFALQHINKLLSFNEEVKKLCHQLTLKEIKTALQDLPNEKLQIFEETYQNQRCDSCGVKSGKRAENTLANDALYQIQFTTAPNNGFFEASIKMNNGKPKIMGEISRLDRFGNQPHCIESTYVHLIKYCYCR